MSLSIMLSGKLFQSVIFQGKKLLWKYVVEVDGHTQGGLRGFDRTPNFCSLKLILSLNIKY